MQINRFVDLHQALRLQRNEKRRAKCIEYLPEFGFRLSWRYRWPLLDRQRLFRYLRLVCFQLPLNNSKKLFAKKEPT